MPTHLDDSGMLILSDLLIIIDVLVTQSKTGRGTWLSGRVVLRRMA